MRKILSLILSLSLLLGLGATAHFLQKRPRLFSGTPWAA